MALRMRAGFAVLALMASTVLSSCGGDVAEGGSSSADRSVGHSGNIDAADLDMELLMLTTANSGPFSYERTWCNDPEPGNGGQRVNCRMLLLDHRWVDVDLVSAPDGHFQYTVNGSPYYGDFDRTYSAIASEFPDQAYNFQGYRGFEDATLAFQIGPETYLHFEAGSSSDSYWGVSDEGTQTALNFAGEMLANLDAS